MSDIEELQKRVLAFRDARDWKQFHNPKDVAISLALEAAEYLEHYQWKNHDEIKEHLDDNKHEVEEELADILFYLLLVAADLQIDLSSALSRKIKKNERRYPVSKSKGTHAKYTELK